MPYEYPERTDGDEARWQDAVAAALRDGTLVLRRKGRHPDFYDLAGACPRCSHSMDQEIEFGVIVGFEIPTYNIDCNCTKDHAGRSDGKSGCGWGGWIGVPIERPGS